MNLATVIDPHPDDAVALVSRGRTTTYGALRAQVSSLRAGLVGLGLETGDRVGIVCGTNWYFAAAYLAVLSAGLVAVPLNPTSPPRELEGELGAVGARAVIVGPAAQGSVARLDRAKLPALEHCVVTDQASICPARSCSTICSRPTLLCPSWSAPTTTSRCSCSPAEPPASRRPRCSPTATCDRTSTRCSRTRAAPQTADDVSLGVLPLFHIFGLNVVLGLSLCAGSRVVLIERFDPASRRRGHRRDTASRSCREHRRCGRRGRRSPRRARRRVRIRAHRRVGRGEAPDRGGRVVRAPLRRRDHGGLRPHRGVSGRDDVSGRRATSRARSARRCRACECGSSTATATTCSSATRARSGCRARTCSRATGTTPTRPRRALTDDGWLRTGDVAVVDDDGQLFLVDRVKDLIIVSGFNVFPAEVEEVLLEHPAVEACAVVGVPPSVHGRGGQGLRRRRSRVARSRRTTSSRSAPSASPATSAPRR